MRRDIGDGGSAFPVVIPQANIGWNSGMTLRDYFAAKAMQGALSGNHPITLANDCETWVAEAAYAIADAMLAARQPKGNA